MIANDTLVWAGFLTLVIPADDLPRGGDPDMADRQPDEVAGPAASRPRPWWTVPLLVGTAIGLAGAGAAILLVDPRPHGLLRPPPRGRSGAARSSRGPPVSGPPPRSRSETRTAIRSRLSSLGGDGPVLVAFLNTRCTDICPVQGRQLADLSRVLPPERRPTIVAISANPEDAYRQRTPPPHRPGAGRTSTGTGCWGARTSWLRCGAPTASWPGPVDAASQVEHSGALYLVDADGDVGAVYTVPIPMPRLVADIETLERA